MAIVSQMDLDFLRMGREHITRLLQRIAGNLSSTL
jgi:hypothetical protein